eukprot:g503.t1
MMLPDSKLEVRILSARDLKASDVYLLQQSSSDPYCKVWNHQSRLRGYEQGDSIKFTIFDEDYVSQDDELGYAVLKSEDFHAEGFYGELRLQGTDVESYIKVQISTCEGEFLNGVKSDEDKARKAGLGPIQIAKSGLGAVIFINTLWLLAQAAFPWFREQSFWIDTAFLAVYVVETVLRIGHWKLQFFSHPDEAGWNWFDLIIVLSGLLEEMESIEHKEKGGHAGKELMALRVFKPLRLLARLARFMRVIRLCRVLLTADFSWVESPSFQSTAGVVIILNAIIMGLETDLESPIFEWTEQFMLGFFVLECTLRIRHRGWDFFMSPEERTEMGGATVQGRERFGLGAEDRGWNIVDFTIVASGVVDDWILKAWSFITQQQQQSAGLSKLMTLARLLRLMRILRLVRVVRAIRPLYMLAIGVVRAMQSMFWVLVLTFVALYALAILTTRAIGRGEEARENERRGCYCGAANWSEIGRFQEDA